jgi:hypothetical protein
MYPMYYTAVKQVQCGRAPALLRYSPILSFSEYRTHNTRTNPLWCILLMLCASILFIPEPL